MMRKASLLVLALCLVPALPRGARAQVFGQFDALQSRGATRMSLGAFFSGGGDELTPTFEAREGLRSGGSVGLQASVEDDIFGAQLDARKGLANTGGSLALDLGGQVAGGFVTGSGSSAVFAQIVPGISREWDLGGRGSQTLALWTGAGLRLSSDPGNSGSTDGLFRLGGRFGFSPEFGMGADFEDVGGGDRLMLGVDYKFGGLSTRRARHMSSR
jgi:hypothetical protein